MAGAEQLGHGVAVAVQPLRLQVRRVRAADLGTLVPGDAEGVEAFEEAWAGRQPVQIGDLEVAVLGKAELIANKKASGRPKDLADIAILESEPE